MGAPKGNKFAVGCKTPGRQSTFQKEMVFTTHRLAQLGATDVEIAEVLGVQERQLNVWKHIHEDFNAALKAGGSAADERVVRTLYQKAVGYTTTEEEVRTILDGPNKGHTERVVREKYIPPETTAAIFWLKNRRKTEWRDRHEIAGTMEHKVEHRHTLDPRNLGDEQRETLRQILLTAKEQIIEGEILDEGEQTS